MKEGLVLALLCLALGVHAADSGCAPHYYVVNDLHEMTTEGQTMSVSFSLNGEHYAFDEMTRTNPVHARPSTARQIVTDTSYAYCPQSFLSRTWAGRNGAYDLRVLRDDRSLRGAVLKDGGVEHIITPAREVNQRCLPSSITQRDDFTSLLLAYSPSDSSQYARLRRADDLALDLLHQGEEDLGILFQSKSQVTSSSNATTTVPRNCPEPVVLSVGIIGQWSYRQRFVSNDDACVEIANVINTISGIFERTVNTQLRLDVAILMTQSSDVGQSPLEAWNGNPCLTTQEQLSSFTAWANESLSYVSVAQLFTGCGDGYYLSWVGSVCNAEYIGAAVAKYNTSVNTTFSLLVARNFGHILGASNDDTGIMATPSVDSKSPSLFFSRKSQLEMCSTLQRQSPDCLVPRDCVANTTVQCGVSCGQYNSVCTNGTVCQNGACVVDLTCSPWCQKKGYVCGPDGCGGQCGSVDLTTDKAVCPNGQLKTSLINTVDVDDHLLFLVNTERAGFGLSALKWDGNLEDKQMRNAGTCDWSNILWVGVNTGHYNLQAEFAVAMEPSGVLNLPHLVASDLFNSKWLCTTDDCVAGNCERYRVYIHNNVTGFACYSQSCGGSSNPFNSSADWSLILCGFVGNPLVSHPFADTEGYVDPTKCERRGNLTGTCTPYTCDDLQLQCGGHADGCGGVLNCGECPLGSNCGDDGQCACKPVSTCEDGFELQCGFLWNGCEYIECECPTSNYLNAVSCDISDGQLSGQCVCDSQAICQQYGAITPTCGWYTTPCGDQVYCGDCGSGYQCVNGMCSCDYDCKSTDECFTERECFGEILCPTESPCTDKANCGLVKDDCGNLQFCGECSGDYNHCIHNLCTCIATSTCRSLDRQCGQFTDECGVTQYCGSCGTGQVCADSIDGSAQCLCEAEKFCSLKNATCGYVESPCGQEFCGVCSSKHFCNLTTSQCQFSKCVPNNDVCSGVECGLVSNGCEMVLCDNTCRAPSEVCSGNTCVCNDDDSICQGKECGDYENDCDGSVHSCGNCSAYGAGYACSADFKCECTPRSCDGLNGVFDDGCGGVIHCGTNPNKPPCYPRNITCAQLGVECGRYHTGCNDDFLECSDCPLSSGGAVQYCVSGTCSCIPNTCGRIGKSCGTWSDGCGSQIYCGTCNGQSTCSSDGTCTCVPLTGVCDGKCGVVFNGCEFVTCAPCLEPSSCLLDITVGQMVCVNTTCLSGQVWDSLNGECRCPYGYEWDSDSDACELIPDDYFDFCFSDNWEMARGRWLTQAQTMTGSTYYNCSTVISSLAFNSRSVTRGIPATSPPQLNANFFVTLPVRAEPSTFEFTTHFQWDIRSSIFGIASLIVDLDGTYVYFIWNFNTRSWELGLAAVNNGSGARYAIAQLPFAAPVQRQHNSMSLQVYRGYSACAIEQPYLGWVFVPYVNGTSAGPYCFNENPDNLIDSTFSPDDSLPFALIDDGYTRFFNPRRISHTRVFVTFWGCIRRQDFLKLITNALSIPRIAVENIQIQQTPYCPSGIAQRTQVTFDLVGGPWGTSSGLASSFLDLVNANLFPYPRHPSFPATQRAVNRLEVPTQVAVTAPAGALSVIYFVLFCGLVMQAFV